MPKCCCPECFGDRGLRKDIFPSLSPTNGTCGFCGTNDVELLEPRLLFDYFELLVNVYEPSPKGKLLVEWMKDDWKLFSHTAMDVAHAKELLSEILDDGDIVRKTFIPSPSYISDALVKWETLREELRYKNRWFLGTLIDLDRLSELLDLLIPGEAAHPFRDIVAPRFREIVAY